MCGFTGFIAFPSELQAELPNRLRQATRMLRHRGPDQSGEFFDKTGAAGMGFARLSIIDLSESGNQPMENEDGNLLPAKDDKSFKKVMNLLRTIQPIEFEVFPKNQKDGEGFSFHAFDIIDKDTTRMNPVFDALFFCSVDTIKKVLSYTPKIS